MGRDSKPSYRTSKRLTIRRSGQRSRGREPPSALCRIDRCIGIAIYTTHIQTGIRPEHPCAFRWIQSRETLVLERGRVPRSMSHIMKERAGGRVKGGRGYTKYRLETSMRAEERRCRRKKERVLDRHSLHPRTEVDSAMVAGRFMGKLPRLESNIYCLSSELEYYSKEQDS